MASQPSQSNLLLLLEAFNMNSNSASQSIDHSGLDGSSQSYPVPDPAKAKEGSEDLLIDWGEDVQQSTNKTTTIEASPPNPKPTEVDKIADERSTVPDVSTTKSEQIEELLICNEKKTRAFWDGALGLEDKDKATPQVHCSKTSEYYSTQPTGIPGYSGIRSYANLTLGSPHNKKQRKFFEKQEEKALKEANRKLYGGWGPTAEYGMTGCGGQMQRPMEEQFRNQQPSYRRKQKSPFRAPTKPLPYEITKGFVKHNYGTKTRRLVEESDEEDDTQGRVGVKLDEEEEEPYLLLDI